MGCLKSKQENYKSKKEQLERRLEMRLEELERQKRERQRLERQRLERERLERERDYYSSRGNGNGVVFNHPHQYPNGTNPYYQEKKTAEDLIKQENQKHQKIIENMTIDGVNINAYITNNSLFYQCPTCSKQFSENQKPNLRNCGHFVCNSQLCYQLECVFPGCRQKSAIKIRNYWPWIVGTYESDITYNFVLTYWGINDVHQYKDISEDKTIQYVISLCPFARSYLQMIPQQHRMVRMGSNMFFYDEVKKRTIKSLTNSTDFKFKVNFMKASAGVGIKNKISCYNKLLGGLNCNQF